MSTWDEDIVSAFISLGGVAPYESIYEEVAKIRPSLPNTWKEIIRRRVQDLSSDSDGFKGKRDLFYSVNGLGSGVWGLRDYQISTPEANDFPKDLSKGNETPGRTPVTNYRILRDTRLARELKALHNNKCQICGLQITLNDGKTYSEAHHIIPLGGEHNGPDVAGNIIVLCPNHHVLCDYGAIELSRDNIRAHPKHVINDESLEYHNFVLRKT